jgi:hypothetical protein
MAAVELKDLVPQNRGMDVTEDAACCLILLHASE